MKGFRHGRSLRFHEAIAGALLFTLALVPGGLAQTPAATVEQVFIVPDSTPPPEASIEEPEPLGRKPLPLGWKIALVVTVVSAAGIALYFSIRTWRFSNLFDRQYRFPPVQNATQRFGGNRSGGCMATIQFSAPASITTQKRAETPPQ